MAQIWHWPLERQREEASCFQMARTVQKLFNQANIETASFGRSFLLFLPHFPELCAACRTSLKGPLDLWKCRNFDQAQQVSALLMLGS